MAACSVDATGNSDAIALTRLRLAVPTVPQHRVAGRVQRQVPRCVDMPGEWR